MIQKWKKSYTASIDVEHSAGRVTTFGSRLYKGPVPDELILYILIPNSHSDIQQWIM